MDSEILSNMTYKDRMLIHRCRIFLQVEVLSDISDAQGESLLKAWLDPYADKPSHSLKNWPKQSDPGREAWKIWRKFIFRAFTYESGKLRRSLGHWTQFNKTREHNSYCNEEATLLYTRSPEGRWRAHARRCAGRRCLIFQSESSDLGELPQPAIPIDIKAQTNDNIITSNNQSPTDLDKGQEGICNGLKEYIVMTAAAQAEHITLLVEEQEISQIVKNSTRIEVASDGGFDTATGISSYGWLIALNRVLVAKGRGPAEAHPDFGESFRSEGYGLV
jgi:hypothetical protein